MRLFSIVFLSFLTATAAVAQAQLLDSRHTLWAGVSVLDYPFEQSEARLEWIGLARIDNQKIAAERFGDYDPTAFLANKIIDDVLRGELPCYPSFLPQPPGDTALSVWDALIVNEQQRMDRAGWVELIRRLRLAPDSLFSAGTPWPDAVIRALVAGAVESYRLKAFYFFDKKKRRLSAKVTGILLVLSAAPAAQADQTLFWVPLPDNADFRSFDRDINKSDYVWIKDVFRTVDFSTDFVTLKGTVDELFREWVWSPLEKRKLKGYVFRTPPGEDNKPIQFGPYMDGLLNRRDTVVTFDPETYEEKIMIVKNEIFLSDITLVSLHQRWYYDDRRNAFFIDIRMVSPSLRKYDDNGYFLFAMPLLHVPLSR